VEAREGWGRGWWGNGGAAARVCLWPNGRWMRAAMWGWLIRSGPARGKFGGRRGRGGQSVKGQHGTWAGGVRNVQGWLRPFGGWDGWSAHTISFLSVFFYGLFVVIGTWINFDCSIMRLFIGVLFSIFQTGVSTVRSRSQRGKSTEKS